MILYWGLSFLIGCGVALHPHFLFALPLVCIAFLAKRWVQILVFFLMGCLSTLYHKPPLDLGPHTGKGIFVLCSIAKTQSPFTQSYALRGKLKSFETNGKLVHQIPCVFFQKQIPDVGSEFYVEGTYENGLLKLSKRPLQALDKGFCLARWRFKAKDFVRGYFHKLSDQKVGHFFASMTTGDVDHLLLSMEFRKWGLSHILAISGFHFALFALVFGSLFRFLFPKSAADFFLMGFLTFVYIYLGSSPSITRAYWMICLYLVGEKMGRIPNPLHLLGASLLFELVSDPLLSGQVGFQLSFLATFSILTLYRPFEQGLRRFFPKRAIESLKDFSFLDKHGYLLSSGLRKALALNFAVHVVTLPVLLFHFHSFPLMSVPLNLILPPLLGLSIMGLPLGPINVAFTRFVLDILSYTPEQFNIQILTPNFPFELALTFCTLLGTLGLTLTHKIGENGRLLRWRS